MVVGMQKKVLSEIGLYYGDVAMPQGFEIDQDKLQSDILKSRINNEKFPYSREWDKLNTYLREHINVEYGFQLINKETWGNRRLSSCPNLSVSCTVISSNTNSSRFSIQASMQFVFPMLKSIPALMI